MIRVTTRDADKTISFRADARLVHSLIAACTSDPNTVEELLLAVEPFVPGTTARVIDSLLDFDIQRESQPGLPPRFADGPLPSGTFEVVDGLTQHMAGQPDEGGILRIDVVNRAIEGNLSSPELLASTGTVSAPGDGDRHTAYALDHKWNVFQVESVPQAAGVASVA